MQVLFEGVLGLIIYLLRENSLRANLLNLLTILGNSGSPSDTDLVFLIVIVFNLSSLLIVFSRFKALNLFSIENTTGR